MSGPVRNNESSCQSLKNNEQLFEELQTLAEKIKNLEFNEKENQVILRGIFLYSFSVMEHEIRRCLQYYYKNNKLCFSDLIPFFQHLHLKSNKEKLDKVIEVNARNEEQMNLIESEIPQIFQKESYGFFDDGIQFEHIAKHLEQIGISNENVEINEKLEEPIKTVIDEVRKKRNCYAHTTQEDDKGIKENINITDLKKYIKRMKDIYIIFYKKCNH